MIIDFPDGMTIKELKKLINNLPDVDENGDPFYVWIANTSEGLTNIVHEFASLDVRSNGDSDILLS